MERRPEVTRAVWTLALIGLAALNTLIHGHQVTECFEYVNPGAAGHCTIGPAIGTPAAWAITAISVVAAAYVVFRLARVRQ